MLAMAITRRQREVYDFISRFVTENGYSPSFEEIGHGLKLNSLATVHKHISNLEKKGLLTRDYNRSLSTSYGSACRIKLRGRQRHRLRIASCRTQKRSRHNQSHTQGR